jgi:hypothetical protein
MKSIGAIFIIISAWCSLHISCQNNSGKNENDPHTYNHLSDTGKGIVDAVAIKPPNDKSATKGIVLENKINTLNDILANIDEYLVSNVNFQTPGITNGILHLHNKLPDVSFQKIIVEVSILIEKDEEYRTDYFTFLNVEPGETKMTKIPKSTRGIKVKSHVVKLKSEELTKGEMVMVGDKFVPR